MVYSRYYSEITQQGTAAPQRLGASALNPSLGLPIHSGGLKLPCIDSARRQKRGWPPYLQRGQVAGGGSLGSLPGQGRALGEGEPSF